MGHAHLTRPAPTAASLAHLRADDATGTWVTLTALLLTTVAGALSFSTNWLVWMIGQLLLALALVQWFVLLHECGHGTLYRSRLANVLTGHVAGLMSLIPFEIWTHVHRRHHRWTGWQDLDPTTSTLAPRPRKRAVLALVRACWAWWVPVFAVAYRAGNFWNPARLAGKSALRLSAGAVACLVVYAAVVWGLGWFATIKLFGLATLVAFALEETLILSQHTHVPMELSAGQRVAPHRAAAQERFTRSLRLPSAVSAWLLHFDAHELHHMYPFVPGYLLREIPYTTANEMSWWRWLRDARAVPGDVLLFQNRHQTGIEL